ncbi:MAG: cellulase family glycosylhydrolase [Fibrobacterales bacterium]
MSNRIKEITFVLTIILFGLISAEAIGPVDIYGEMKVKGQYFVGSKKPYTNAMVQVKGLSFSWNQWGGENFWTAEVVDQMVDDFDAEVLRVAVSTTSGGKPADFEFATTVIDQCIARGVYIIIDFHSHHAWDEIPEAKEFFTKAVEKYGQYDNIIFEIFNEPVTEDPHEWGPVKDYADELIGHIRELGSDNLILVGTPSYGQVFRGIINDPVNDPSNNSAYVMHFYAYSHFVDDGWTGQHFKDALQDGLPFFVSEWGISHYNGGKGEFEGSFDGESADAWHAVLDEYGFSSAMWAITTDGQSSALWGNDAGGEQYITDMLDEWKITADWRTNTIRALPGEFIVGAADIVVAQPETEAVLNGLVSGGKSPYTYEWTSVTGGSSLISDSQIASPIITGLELGSYTFALVVSDADGIEAETEVTISVVEPVVLSSSSIDESSSESSSENVESSDTQPSNSSMSSSSIEDTSSSSKDIDEEEEEEFSSSSINTPSAEGPVGIFNDLKQNTTNNLNVSLIYKVTNKDYVSINVLEPGRYVLHIYDAMGKHIGSQTNDFTVDGSQSLFLQTPMKEGLYAVVIESGILLKEGLQ